MNEEVLKIAQQLAKHFEGCRLNSYWDAPGKCWTVGYGCTGSTINQHTRWTQAMADNALLERLIGAYQKAVKLSPILETTTPERCAAIVDFIYNCGDGAYRKSSLKMAIDEGHWENASMEILKWNHAGGKILPGLVKRRVAESDLITQPGVHQ